MISSFIPYFVAFHVVLGNVLCSMDGHYLFFSKGNQIESFPSIGFQKLEILQFTDVRCSNKGYF